MEALDHLVQNPQFDVDKVEDPEKAVCGVEHYGVHCETGNPTGDIRATSGLRIPKTESDVLLATYMIFFINNYNMAPGV